jgi:integrase
MSTITERKWANGTKSAWQLRYTDKNGQRHAEQFKLKRDADARLREIEAELYGGIHTPRSKARKVEDLVPDWLEQKATELKRERSTVDQYRCHANLHILPRIGKRRLVDLTPKDVADLFRDLVADLSPVMAKYVARSFRDLMDFATNTGCVSLNVAKDVRVAIPSAELVETDEEQDQPLPIPSPQIVGQLLSAAPTELAAEIGCSALAGLRSEEVRALKWKDIDFCRHILRVRRAANRQNELKPTKSEAGTRSVPLSPNLTALLQAWRRANVQPDDLVFPTEAGKLKRYERLVRIELYPMLDELGVKRFPWHQLRDFFATTMVAAGVPKEQLKAWMGHKEWSTTQKYYVHPLPGDDDRSVMAQAQHSIKIFWSVGTTAGNGPNYLQQVHS